MSVPIHTSPSLRVGTPVPLVERMQNDRGVPVDVSSAERFRAIVSETRASETALTVVLNWTAGAGR